MDRSHHRAHDPDGRNHNRRHRGSHRQAHSHAHVPKDFGTMFAIAISLNLDPVAIRVFYGVIAHSVALRADAEHNFGDALGLIVAWGAFGGVLSELAWITEYDKRRSG